MRRGVDAEGDEILLGLVGAAVAEGEVVLLGAALVAMAFDEQVVLRVLLQPGRGVRSAPSARRRDSEESLYSKKASAM